MRRKTLLVTGASAGTGAATAQAAAVESYDTAIINYCSDRASADTVAQMVNAQGCEAVVIRADITDPAAVAAMFEQITALPPAALNLVNNAGIVAPRASMNDLTPDRVSAYFSQCCGSNRGFAPCGGLYARPSRRWDGQCQFVGCPQGHGA